MNHKIYVAGKVRHISVLNIYAPTEETKEEDKDIETTRETEYERIRK